MLIVDYNRGTGILVRGSDPTLAFGEGRIGPIKEFFRNRSRGVDTAVTHPIAKIGMPVSAVDAVIALEKHGKGDIGQIIVSTVKAAAAFHLGVADLVPNGKFSNRSFVP